MNEATYILAILVNKGILTDKEAIRLKRSMSENIINSDLKQMIEKVEKSIKVETSDIETIDANDIIK